MSVKFGIGFEADFDKFVQILLKMQRSLNNLMTFGPRNIDIIDILEPGRAVTLPKCLYWVVWVVWALWSLSTVRAAKFEIAWPNRDYIG